MDYSRIYDHLINDAKHRALSGYKEKHHILPRSMGGSNFKSNLVNLTAREHFVAHLLLWRIHKNDCMAQTVFLMCNLNGLRLNSKMYEICKLQSALAKSIAYSGKPSPKKGRPSGKKGITYILTDEERKLRSDARKNKGLGNPGFVGKHKPESIQLMRKAQSGHPPTNYKKISIDGIEYNSMAEAARRLGITYNVIQRNIKVGKIKVDAF